MNKHSLFSKINERGSPKLAVLIDPDKHSTESLHHLLSHTKLVQVDFFLVGGSLLLSNFFEECISILKQNTLVPVIIFPGNHFQISKRADAILFLSLLSGRNPEFLISQQLIAAPAVKESSIEVIPTAYLLIDGGRVSTTAYITQTTPIPSTKSDLAAATALTAEYLGMKVVYLEAGSGASQSVPVEMIQAVRRHSSLPIIVGGGIRTPDTARQIAQAGANLIVIGNVLEKNPSLIKEISSAIQSAQ